MKNMSSSFSFYMLLMNVIAKQIHYMCMYIVQQKIYLMYDYCGSTDAVESLLNSAATLWSQVLFRHKAKYVHSLHPAVF